MKWLAKITGRLPRGSTIVRVSGGLANQMLCYKLGRFLADLRHGPLILDASPYDTETPDPTRDLQLTKYPLKYDDLVPSKAGMRRLKDRNSISFITREMIAAGSSSHRAGLMDLIRTTHIVQCDFWLALALRTEVDEAAKVNGALEDLTLVWQNWFDARDRDLLSLIETAPHPVAIHVRRGDFATHDGNLLLTPDYYNAAIAEVSRRVADPLFVVFSDDILWCRDNLRIDGECRFVDWHDDNMAFKDMYLASRCAHFILSNESTFSHQFVQLNRARADRILITSTMQDLERNARPAAQE
jgi:hypothetical protein